MNNKWSIEEIQSDYNYRIVYISLNDKFNDEVSEAQQDLMREFVITLGELTGLVSVLEDMSIIFYTNEELSEIRTQANKLKRRKQFK